MKGEAVERIVNMLFVGGGTKVLVVGIVQAHNLISRRRVQV